MGIDIESKKLEVLYAIFYSITLRRVLCTVLVQTARSETETPMIESSIINGLEHMDRDLS